MTNNISHTFTLNAIDASVDTDVKINVVKRREVISYQQSLPTTATNIAFVSSKEISADNSLTIADRSASLSANRIISTGYTTITNVNNFTISSDDFVVTDIFTSVSNTIAEIPLFYQHVIDSVNLPRETDGSISSGYTLQSVELLDQFLNSISVQEKKLDSTNGILYLNLLPEYNGLTDYSVYYMKYVVRDSTGEVSVYIDLLDVEKIYTLATFDDIDESLSLIQDGRKVYLLDSDVNQFTVTLPSVGTYAFQPIGTGRIRLLYPTAQSSTDPWFVRVSNSYLYTTIESQLYKYGIGEFLSQPFAPFPPYKLAANETSTVLSEKLVKLDQTNVYEDTILNLYISLLVSNSSGTARVAFTTDPSLAGTASPNGLNYEKWSLETARGIKSVDHLTGVLEIDGLELSTTDIVTADYYYEATNYEYSFINFNPLLNSDVLSGRVSIFVDPDTVLTSKDQTLFFMHSDETGKVVECNYSYFDNDTQTWNSGYGDKTLYYESLPNFLQTTTSGQANYVDPSTVDYFVPNYTVEGDTSLNTFAGFLVLGDITVAPAISIQGVTTIDTRRRGGGIIEVQLEDTITEYPEANWVWDNAYRDGTPYPGNASYMIEVPVSVLDDAGGTLTQNKVREIVERHTAAGVYPIVKGYGIDISVDAVWPTESGILLKWESNGY